MDSIRRKQNNTQGSPVPWVGTYDVTLQLGISTGVSVSMGRV